MSLRYYYEFLVKSDRVYVVEGIGDDILSNFRFRIDKWKNSKWSAFLSEERNKKLLSAGRLCLSKTIDDKGAFIRDWAAEILEDNGFNGLCSKSFRAVLPSDEDFVVLKETREDALINAQYRWYKRLDLDEIGMFLDFQDTDEDSDTPSETLVVTIKGKAYLYTLDSEMTEEEVERYENGDRGVEKLDKDW